MREVVERLRAEGSEAIDELGTFDSSFDALLKNLGLLALAAGELHVAAQNIDAPGTIEGFKRVRAMRERAERLSTRSTEVLSAFRALRADVMRWNIMGIDGD